VRRISLLHLSLLSLAMTYPALALSPSQSAASTTTASVSTEPIAEDYFGLKLKVGQKIGNIFSATVSSQGGGIDEQVQRVSGSALYEVVDASPDRPRYLSTGRYDGAASRTGVSESRDNGQTACSVKTGKCRQYLDTSGIDFNQYFWGKPTGKLTAGMSWKVELPVPWEIGPTGTETVTVIRVDPANHEVMLKREGSGEGPWDGESKQMNVKRDGKEYTVDLTPGTTHWVGFTVFREGLTVSDETLATRTSTISSKEFGTSTINERAFTLLNQSPPDLL
jgi:hypothetical protein